MIGTFRSQEKAAKLHGQLGNYPKLSFEIVEDMSSLNAFNATSEKRSNEIKVVLHTTSPWGIPMEDYEKYLLIPAVRGTQGILNSIRKYGAHTVERVIVTSSFGAMLNYSKLTNDKAFFAKKDWNPATWEGCQTDGLNAYCASK